LGLLDLAHGAVDHDYAFERVQNDVVRMEGDLWTRLVLGVALFENRSYAFANLEKREGERSLIFFDLGGRDVCEPVEFDGRAPISLHGRNAQASKHGLEEGDCLNLPILDDCDEAVSLSVDLLT
jgi:hypothetical protein